MYEQGTDKPLLNFRPRWTIKQKKWGEWKQTFRDKEIQQSEDTLEYYNLLIQSIITTSNKTFTFLDSSKPRKPGQPWWIAEYAKVVKEGKLSKKEFRKRPTLSKKSLFNRKSREGKEIILQAKNTAWEKNYVPPRPPYTCFQSLDILQSNEEFSSNLNNSLLKPKRWTAGSQAVCRNARLAIQKQPL